MDFSAWNWATSFRLHETACLIAGVMPISKRQPTTEELPSQARPILVKLMAAYVEWHLQKRNPDRPKSTFLEGYLNDDGALPEINSLAELPGALASREAINRFLLQIEGELGLKSAYDFGPICKTADPFSTDDQHPTQRTPTPDEPALNAQTAPDDPERRLSRLRELGGSEPPQAVPAESSASTRPGKVWTAEKLAEAKAYREKYGTRKTAAHYQVSEARIRALLPSNKPRPKGFSVFTHRME